MAERPMSIRLNKGKIHMVRSYLGKEDMSDSEILRLCLDTYLQQLSKPMGETSSVKDQSIKPILNYVADNNNSILHDRQMQGPVNFGPIINCKSVITSPEEPQQSLVTVKSPIPSTNKPVEPFWRIDRLSRPKMPSNFELTPLKYIYPHKATIKGKKKLNLQTNDYANPIIPSIFLFLGVILVGGFVTTVGYLCHEIILNYRK